MSYILDALKKSEQERNPDRVPDLSTHHEHVSQAPQKSFPWVWLVLALVATNLFVIYWLFFMQPDQPPVGEANSEQQPAEQPIANESAVKETVSSAIPSTEQEVQVSEPADAVQAAQAEETVVTMPQTPPEVTATPVQQPIESPRVLGFDELPHISELSLSVQNQLPDMMFTTHIYVKDGGSFVIINDRNLSDGMSMGNGVMLERIVREGVIMSFRDRYFTLNSMESWSR